MSSERLDVHVEPADLRDKVQAACVSAPVAYCACDCACGVTWSIRDCVPDCTSLVPMTTITPSRICCNTNIKQAGRLA